MGRRKDGRPRSTTLTSTITPCPAGWPFDESPWEHSNGGRIPYRYGIPGHDAWAPRAGRCLDREHYPLVD